MRLLILARHGQSLQNVDGTVNGDPGLDRGLSPLGAHEAEQLGRQLAGIAVELCATSEFPRARETARLALAGRTKPATAAVDPDLNDVRIGELEGEQLDVYRAWRHVHARAEPFPGGESLDAAARRYADAFERLLDHPEQTVLCVCHEIPVRYAVNAGLGSGELDGPVHDIPNAVPYVFDSGGLHRAVARMRELAPR